MLHELPIRNVRLLACTEDWHGMTPTEQGRHCRSCDREVVDFTQATAADLTAARAAAPDGRLCGRFHHHQVVVSAGLRLRQRWFLAAAVLVLLQGLSACEVREQLPAAPTGTTQPAVDSAALSSDTAQFSMVDYATTGIVLQPMPEFPGGYEAMLDFLRTAIRYPDTEAEGKVFITFTIDGTGAIHDAKVLKGVHPLLDAEALRAVQLMPRWQLPDGSPPSTSIGYTVPITFTRAADSTRNATQ